MRSGPCGGRHRSRLGRRGSITDRQPAFDKRTISKLGKTYKYTGVNLACNVPRQKVNFPACKLPTASPLPPPPPPPPDNRLSSGLVIASFQMEMPVASLLPGSP